MACFWYYLGVYVIRSSGSFIYNTIRHSPQKNNIADPKYLKIFTIETTTSKSAAEKIPAHKLKLDGICPKEALDEYPEYIYISFWKRNCLNKLEYLLYVLIRAIYVSAWYYFAPLIALMVGYIATAY